ncbi:hypothetical protein [Polyangium sp. y55x31]|uniref:hypothetical protein n=1 Tax=Polyangium sp. y55x31 TaxID=3042688 RepID=UPI002482CA26|nr:hypothetical protein [Polyangium sp. y55x31]MDI1476952.1 hypothetical protein [Polyangium sp. y55x31]
MSYAKLVSPTFVATLALTVAACGGPAAENPPPADPANATSTTPTAAPSAAPTATPTAAPEAKPEAKSAAPAEPAKPKGLVHDVDGPDGIRRWALWDGPKTGAAITTPKAWVVAPNMGSMNDPKDSFAAVRLKLVTVLKADANEVVYEERGNKYAVPAALARPAVAPKGLKKGAYAICNFGQSHWVGRIEAVDAKSATCALWFMKKLRKEKLPLEEVLAFEGPLGMGSYAMVHFEGGPDTESWYPAQVFAVSGEDVWVEIDTQFGNGYGEREGRRVHKVKTSNARPIDVSKPLAVGAPCLTEDNPRLGDCKVKKVIEGGLAYELTFKDGQPFKEEWDIGTVAPLPKEAKPAK